MCFECDIWVTNKSEWEEHCQQLLDSLADLLRCDPLVFRNAPVKPGLCPFCLGDNSKLPSKRIFQFVPSPSAWHLHIEVCQSLEELTYHLTDTHCWRPRRGSPKKRKWAIFKE
ncbi:hypothetical protein N7453_010999 [Penicillium expansum]|nr:hypothetical protein N7453_010999 [Penicillium expansum]